MKVKKLLSAFLATALLSISVLGVTASDGEEAAANGIAGNNILGVAANESIINFPYTATESASATVTVDVDENVKTTVYDENYNDLTAGTDTVLSANKGDSYTGNAGVAAAVVDNPGRSTEGDNCLSIGKYQHNRYTVYDGTSYDAVFWMRAVNTDWDMMNIQVKPDVYLAFRGQKIGEAGKSHSVGFYVGYSAVSNNPAVEVANGNASCLAYINLNDYGYYWSNGTGNYWRIVSTYNNVKVYINSTADFTNVKPIMDVNLSGDKMDARSFLQFGNGNTDLWIDDVTIKEIGTAPTTEGDEGKGLLVKDVDFEEKTITVPDNTTFASNDTDGYLVMTPKAGDAVLFDALQGDYKATFWFKGGNAAWDSFRIRIRDNYYLHFRGTSMHGGTIKDSLGNNAYGIAIMKNNDYYSNTFLTSAALPANANGGYYVKIEFVDRVVRVWMVQTSLFTGEFVGDPLISYEITDSVSNSSPFTFANKDTGGAHFDDLKIVSANKGNYGKLIYSNDFDMYTYSAANAALVTNETTGNITLQKGNAVGTQWNTTTLFSTPENYEMTFYVNAGNNAYNQASMYLKNDIRLRFMGRNTSGNSQCEIWLTDGDTKLQTYVVGSAGGILGDLPFNPGYVKVNFNGENLQVYMSKNADFVNSYLIFEHTFEGLDTTDKTIRISSDNTLMTYDNFKVYDLDAVDNANIGGNYKQLVIKGTSMLLMAISNNGDAGSSVAEYTLPYANARYRISVGKNDNKLIVYVNGRSVMEVYSDAAGLIYYDGVSEAYADAGFTAPVVISAGDLDYNGSLETADLIMMKKILLGADETDYFTETVNVDNSADLAVNVLDFIRLKKLIAANTAA